FHISQATEFFGYLTGMAVPLINLATIFTAAMTISLVPAISESRALNDVFGIRAKTRTAFRVALIITCPCFVGMYFLAEKIAALIYNAPGAADAIQTMSVGILLLGLHQISTGILQGLGRTSIPVINMILAAAVKVFLSWTLTAIPTLGIKGAAMATVVDFGLAAVLNMIFIYKYTGFALSFSGVFKPAVSAAAMGAAVYGVITLAVSWGAWAILAAIAVAVPVYGGVLLAVGGMGKDDLESLPFIGHRLLAAGQKLGYFR
ncbi:polysaccharide biosynthesis C-terminal domain-containing protein, partial [Phascolarctobacterium faecium]